MPLILFSRAFSFVVEIATRSLSTPITRAAPKRFAASASIPLPVPRSTINSGERTRLACWRSRPRDRDLFRRLSVRAPKMARACACAPQNLITRSSIRNDIAVVACAPVPNAAPDGIINWLVDGRFFRDRTMINRLPILSGLVFCFHENRLCQSAGSFSIRPPNCFVKFCS